MRVQEHTARGREAKKDRGFQKWRNCTSGQIRGPSLGRSTRRQGRAETPAWLGAAAICRTLDLGQGSLQFKLGEKDSYIIALRRMDRKHAGWPRTCIKLLDTRDRRIEEHDKRY